jgi:uroporphyrinogen decarboxylase
VTGSSPRPTPISQAMRGEERLLAAVAGRRVDATPAWFMRQAGGSLPGYLALRERYSVEEIARTPELAAEVSLMPVDEYGVDGAVMYADIMLPLAGMGVDLHLTPAGPVIEHPLRSAADVARLRPLDPETDVPSLLDAIRHVRRALGGRAALIGITGAPFTLAAYLVEGGPSRDQAVAKAFMYREPDAWRELMTRLSTAIVAYVQAQARAGAQVVKVFDSWAGTLGPADYGAFAAPYTRPILAALSPVPTIHFVAGSAGILEQVADVGGDVIAIDARQSLARARERLGEARAVQGNLDPARLLAGWPAVENGTRAVLEEAGGRPGHIFNLGHAAPRETDPGLLRDLVAFVHDSTRSDRP